MDSTAQGQGIDARSKHYCARTIIWVQQYLGPPILFARNNVSCGRRSPDLPVLSPACVPLDQSVTMSSDQIRWSPRPKYPIPTDPHRSLILVCRSPPRAFIFELFPAGDPLAVFGRCHRREMLLKHRTKWRRSPPIPFVDIYVNDNIIYIDINKGDRGGSPPFCSVF